MDYSVTDSPTWEEIERSESYLVCCMFEEAASSASSVIKKLCGEQNASNNLFEKNELDDMLESAGMVLVQSLKSLGRTSEILNELKLLFANVAVIPLQVFHTGTCFQISENHFSGVQESLEEFLGKWRYVDEGCYICEEAGTANIEESGSRNSLAVDKYLEIVELYVTFLVTAKKDMDLALSWVDKATLPLEKKQDLLSRLHSINSHKAASSSQASLEVRDYRTKYASMKEEKVSNSSPEHLEDGYLSGPKNTGKGAILKLSGQGDQSFWWFRTIKLKFGNNRFVITNGKIFLGFLALIVYYIMRRKQVNLKRYIKKQALTMKKAVVDIWQLAFSFQVNPLAAVQPLPTATHGSR